MIPIEVLRSSSPVEYPEAINFMEGYVDKIIAGEKPGCIWLLEHPPIITKGTSANDNDLLMPPRFPVYESGRGGKFTYHGPGQRIVYIMMNLKDVNIDIRVFVQNLERWLIDSLRNVGLQTYVNPGKVGVWVQNSNNGIESKIAAIGLRIKRWVSFHGVAINVCPNLNHFESIIPCGIKDLGVTSLKNEGIDIPMGDLDTILTDTFCNQFRVTIINDDTRDYLRY